MEMRANQNYVITSSVHVGESEFVLGVNERAPSQFVTWKCADSTDYYWGHYFDNLFDAEKDLVARAQEEVKYLEQSREKAETVKQYPAKKEKERER